MAYSRSRRSFRGRGRKSFGRRRKTKRLRSYFVSRGGIRL